MIKLGVAQRLDRTIMMAIKSDVQIFLERHGVCAVAHNMHFISPVLYPRHLVYLLLDFKATKRLSPTRLLDLNHMHMYFIII